MKKTTQNYQEINYRLDDKEIIEALAYWLEEEHSLYLSLGESTLVRHEDGGITIQTRYKISDVERPR